MNPSHQYFTNIAHTHHVTGLKGEGSMLSFIETNNGNIIATSWGDGIFRYDKNFNLLPIGIKGFKEAGITAVWDMYLSKDKDVIWMAAQPGIFKYSQSTGSGVYYKPPLLQNRTVRQIVEDSRGKLWIGMHGFGLFQWDPSRATRSFYDGIVKITSLPNAMINCLILDKYGWLWIATGNYGLYARNTETGKQIQHFKSLSNSKQTLELDMKLRHEAFLLFKEGLRSLVEAGTKHCIVHMSLEKTKLLFTIEFENEGCNMEQLNNLLNRHDMETRLHAIGAKLNVEVHKSRSMFLLQLIVA